MGRLRLLLFVSSVLSPVVASMAMGQDAGRRVFDEQLRVKMDEQARQARAMGLDCGGWFTFAFMDFDDASTARRRTLRQYQLRLWADATFGGAHEFYVRGLTGWNDWNTVANPGDMKDHYNSAELERAWYQFDLGRLLELQNGRRPEMGFKFRVGRDYMQFGTGLALATVLDLLRWDVSWKNLEATFLLSKTVQRSRNIDDSIAMYDHQDRCLWGAQLRYTGMDDHRPFVYFLANKDHTMPSPRTTFLGHEIQQYSYDSSYVGLGSEGKLICPDLRYSAELVGEFGRTYSNLATARQDSIRAMALDAMLEYSFRAATSPKVSFEYLYAGGDSDRATSATSTAGGNLYGTRDYAFNGFGFRDTGLAFAPRMSNLHMYCLGGGFFPLECVPLFKKMELGAKVFFYHKAAANGAISDTTAALRERSLGWEWDVYMDWRITSDIMWTVRYGSFHPGGAFPNDDMRDFLYTALTYSF